MKTFGKVFATLALVLSGFILITAAAHYWMMFAHYLDRQVTSASAAVVDSVASAGGYVKPSPELDELSTLELAERECYRWQLNPSLCRAVMHVESRGEQLAISPKGALGPMQVMQFHAVKTCGLKNAAELLDKEKNIACGVRILAGEMKHTNDNVVRALRRYNGGNFCEFNSCRETDAYVQSVLARLSRDLRA
jgi:soluble lytic murein transglycosylase-like protein